MLTLITIGCISCTKTKTNREQFDESLEKNITAGIKPLIDKGVDSLVARNCISCFLETMYQIDSTYFLKPLDQVKAIYAQNEDKLQKCMLPLSHYVDSVSLQTFSPF